MSSSSNHKGFTLIELMVALSIFSIVSFVATSTIITVMNSYRKAQNVKLLVDNLSFALDSMSFKIREGLVVSVANTEIHLFYPASNDLYYRFNSDAGSIEKCIGNIDNCTAITSPEISLRNVLFTGNNVAGRSMITISVLAEAGGVAQSKSSVTMQTTASTRSNI